MANLNTLEIKAFLPARDFALSQRFYVDLGFSMPSCDDDIAYLHYGECSFLLQNFYVKELADNLMMHLLVEDVDAWWDMVRAKQIGEKYGVKVGALENQPWRMRDFVLFDPSGILWRIAQNIN